MNTEKQAAPEWLKNVGGSINNFLQKPENRWVLPSLVGGGLLGAGSTLLSPRSGMGSVLSRGLLGSLLGAGLGWGLPRLFGGQTPGTEGKGQPPTGEADYTRRTQKEFPGMVGGAGAGKWRPQIAGKKKTKTPASNSGQQGQPAKKKKSESGSKTRAIPQRPLYPAPAKPVWPPESRSGSELRELQRQYLNLPPKGTTRPPKPLK